MDHSTPSQPSSLLARQLDPTLGTFALIALWYGVGTTKMAFKQFECF